MFLSRYCSTWAFEDLQLLFIVEEHKLFPSIELRTVLSRILASPRDPLVSVLYAWPNIFHRYEFELKSIFFRVHFNSTNSNVHLCLKPKDTTNYFARSVCIYLHGMKSHQRILSPVRFVHSNTGLSKLDFSQFQYSINAVDCLIKFAFVFICSIENESQDSICSYLMSNCFFFESHIFCVAIWKLSNNIQTEICSFLL